MSMSRRQLTEADLDGASDQIRERTLTGVRWLALCRMLVQVAALGSALIVARLVTPAEFGRASVALVVWSIAGIVGVEGFGAALVQRKRINRRQLEAVAWIAYAGSITVGIVVFAIAGLVLPSMIDDETAHLTQLVSIGF